VELINDRRRGFNQADVMYSTTVQFFRSRYRINTQKINLTSVGKERRRCQTYMYVHIHSRYLPNLLNTMPKAARLVLFADNFYYIKKLRILNLK
jgi:hypothetical protein